MIHPNLNTLKKNCQISAFLVTSHCISSSLLQLCGQVLTAAVCELYSKAALSFFWEVTPGCTHTHTHAPSSTNGYCELLAVSLLPHRTQRVLIKAHQTDFLREKKQERRRKSSCFWLLASQNVAFKTSSYHIKTLRRSMSSQNPLKFHVLLKPLTF